MERKDKEQYIFGSIFLLGNKLQLIGDQNIDSLTIKQWFLVIMIKNMSKDKPTVTEIAEFIGSTRQNVKQMLVSLEKKGFVKLSKSEEDGRALSVELTEETFKYFEKTEDYGNELLDKLFGGISLEDIDNIVGSINLLFNAMDNFK